MSAPSDHPSTRSLRAFVTKRTTSTFALGKKDDNMGVLKRGKSVLKNVAGGVRKSVSVGEGLLLRRDNHDFQERACESATLLRVGKQVLEEKALENSRVHHQQPNPPASAILDTASLREDHHHFFTDNHFPPSLKHSKNLKTVKIADSLLDSASSKESKDDDDFFTEKRLPPSAQHSNNVKSVKIANDLLDSASSKESKDDDDFFVDKHLPASEKLCNDAEGVKINLADQKLEPSKPELPTDPKSEDQSPPTQNHETPSDENNPLTKPNVRTSYRKHSNRIEGAPDDGGTSYSAHTGRIKTTGFVERSMAAAVISAARQRGLSKRAKPPLSARPLHHRPHGGYCNPWDSALKESGMRTRGGSGSRTFFHKVAKDRRPPDEQLAGMLLLAGRPDFEAGEKALEDDKYALASHWIGHSTFLLQTRGLTVLTDPVWSARLGPLGPKRLVPPPCEIDQLPDIIDVVILSSACYDAFDKLAVQRLVQKVNMWLVPLGLKVLLTGNGVDEAKITELDWWQEHRVKGCLFACTPAQHYSVRDDALWCSWVIHASHHRIFFCGATGYRAVQRETEDSDSYDYRTQFGGPSCPVFREVSRRYGACDTAFLPIGGFKPRVLMSGVQGDAIDMLSVHRDLRSRRSIAHRWGTFSCADEGMLDAVRALEAGILSSPVAEHEFSYLKHGRLHVT